MDSMNQLILEESSASKGILNSYQNTYSEANKYKT